MKKESIKLNKYKKKNKILFRRNENNVFFKNYNYLPEYYVNSITKSKIKL